MINLALIQHSFKGSKQATIDFTLAKIAESAKNGANLVALQELHTSEYFCQREDVEFFSYAESFEREKRIFADSAKKHKIVLVTSLFEKRAKGLYHNTAVVFEKDGSIAGQYRKMHIPDDPSFYEKFYFTPGDNDFKPIQTSLGKIGVLICWDQWFPEAARLMALSGAEIIIYPTAIGWDLNDSQDEKQRQLEAWKAVQRGHAVANGVFVCAVNRHGIEGNSVLGMQFRTCENFGESTDFSLVLSPKFSQIQKPYRNHFDCDSLCESTTNQTQIAEFALDSANSQNLNENCNKIAESTNICHSKSFSCHSERSEESKNNPSLRADSQNLRGNPQGFARAVARSNQPPIEKAKDSQGGLPRSHSLARNDEILDSSVATLPQNDNIGLDSADSQNLGENCNKNAESANKTQQTIEAIAVEVAEFLGDFECKTGLKSAQCSKSPKSPQDAPKSKLSVVESKIHFWGNSFVFGPQGEPLALASENKDEILQVKINLRRISQVRNIWPFLRDRRIEFYGDLTKRFID